MSSEDKEIIGMFDCLPSWKKDKLGKVLFLIRNNSQRLARLFDLHDSGQLSNDDLWRLI